MAKIFENAIDKWQQSDKKSLRTAINAKCAECFGCTATHSEPNYKKMIKHCTSYSCSLHDVRPYQSKIDEDND